MPQWGSIDNSANSVLWGPALVNLAPNTANRNNLYVNQTSSAFIQNQKVGMFAANTEEVQRGTGNLVSGYVTFMGSGYTANAVVTLSGGGGAGGVANATANSTGRISALNVQNVGNGYISAPIVTIAAPSAITFNANSAVTDATDFITIASNILQNGDRVRYLVAASNTAIQNLTNNALYYVVEANSSGVKLSLTYNGAAINIAKGLTQTGHSLTGEQATGVLVIGGGQNMGVTHTGWVVRREGTGGRAGRVHYEVLVAGGIAGDFANDSVILP